MFRGYSQSLHVAFCLYQCIMRDSRDRCLPLVPRALMCSRLALKFIKQRATNTSALNLLSMYPGFKRRLKRSLECSCWQEPAPHAAQVRAANGSAGGESLRSREAVRPDAHRAHLQMEMK